MKTNVLIITILIVLFSSCKEDTKINPKIKAETKDISLLDTLTLRLDNGEKWVVNNETQIGINKMDSVITAFNGRDKKDYSNLGKDLSIQIGYIIRSCNMQGEAHDQLHVVLVPMLNEISVLKEYNNKLESKKALSNLEELIDAYYNHFKF